MVGMVLGNSPAHETSTYSVLSRSSSVTSLMNFARTGPHPLLKVWVLPMRGLLARWRRCWHYCQALWWLISITLAICRVLVELKTFLQYDVPILWILYHRHIFSWCNRIWCFTGNYPDLSHHIDCLRICIIIGGETIQPKLFKILWVVNAFYSQLTEHPLSSIKPLIAWQAQQIGPNIVLGVLIYIIYIYLYFITQMSSCIDEKTVGNNKNFANIPQTNFKKWNKQHHHRATQRQKQRKWSKNLKGVRNLNIDPRLVKGVVANRDSVLFAEHLKGSSSPKREEKSSAIQLRSTSIVLNSTSANARSSRRQDITDPTMQFLMEK